MATKIESFNPAAAGRAPAPQPAPPRLDGAGRFVVVVDDDPDARDLLCSILIPQGFDVATVDSGKECIKIFQRRPVDLLLLDLHMPEMEGMEVLDHVIATWPKTRVVIVSAFGDWPTYFEAMKKGAVDLLQKPYSQDELLRVVRVALRQME